MTVLRLLGRPLIIVFQSVMLALGQIWSNKFRSLLTTLGIVIGVASVTAVIAALTGLKNKVLDDFAVLGTNKLAVYADVPNTGRLRHASYDAVKFRSSDFDDLLNHCPSVKEYTRMTYDSDRVHYGDKTEENVSITGIEGPWHTIQNRGVEIGRPFSLVDYEQGRHVCLINPTLRDRLYLDRDCVGVSIFVGQYRYIVVGVVEASAQSSMFNFGRSQCEVLLPFKTLITRNSRPNVWVEATARSTDASEEAIAELTFFLRRTRQLKPDEPNTFSIHAADRFIEQFNKTAMTMTLVATGLVGISLLVGGIGIMNIMLVSVSERTREIGLRKAVGARPSAILLQFLVEACTLCFFGGLVGLLAGHGLSRLIASIPGANLTRAEIPVWAVFLALGFSGSVGLIFGMFPAIKASRLDPIVALRHE